MVRRLILFTVNVGGSLLIFFFLAMIGLLLTAIALLKHY
jgi:hypothetical protein